MDSISERCKKCIDLVNEPGTLQAAPEGWRFEWILRFEKWTVQERVTIKDDQPLSNPSLGLDAVLKDDEPLYRLMQNALRTLENILRDLTAQPNKASISTPASVSCQSHVSQCSTPSFIPEYDVQREQAGHSWATTGPALNGPAATHLRPSSDSSGDTILETHPSRATDRVGLDCRFLDQSLEHLVQLSAMGRLRAKDRPLPSMAECPDLYDDGIARLIYLRAWDIVTNHFPQADAEIRQRQAAGLSLTLAGLIREQWALRGDGHSPRYPVLATDGPSHELLQPRVSARRIITPRRGRKRKRGAQSEPGPSRGTADDIFLPLPVRVNSAPVHSPESASLVAGSKCSSISGDVAFVGSFPLTFDTHQRYQVALANKPDDHNTFGTGPYVCPFTPCRTAYKRYTTRTKWEEHLKSEHMTPTWICTARAHKSDIVKFAERGEAEAHLMQAHRIHESVVGLLSKALERNTDIPNNCRFCLEPVSTHPGSADDLRSDYLQHTAAHFAELADTYVPMMREFEALTQHLLAEHPLSLLERQTPTLPRSDSDRLRQWIHTFVDPLIRPLETEQDEEDDQPPRKSRMLSTGTDITLTREPEALAHGTAESSGQLPSRRPHYTLAAQINE